MSKIRKAAVCGMFYPEDKKTLQKTVKDLLDKTADLEHSFPKAVIAPHAGYIYSGAVAASAYKPLIKLKDKIKKIVLFGPSHHVGFYGMALSNSDYFETPLGKIELDKNLANSIKNLPAVLFNDEAHESEHSLEVHLPFLQEIFDNDFTLLPIVVGEAAPQEVAKVIESFWNDPEILVIISTDLSHYHDYFTALKLDIATCEDVENLNFEKLEGQRMCGAMPIKGLLYLAKNKNLKVKMVDFCNSGDSEYQNYLEQSNNDNILPPQKIAQLNINEVKKYLDKNNNRGVVGYGAYYVGKEEDLGYILSKPQKLELLRIAYKTIFFGAQNKQKFIDDIRTIFRYENSNVATFVTLEIDGHLRGCIGTLEAHRNIINDVANNAFAAAFGDPRFPAVSEEELENLDIHISILSKAQKIEFKDEADLLSKIRPQIDGLILSEKGGYRGTFLPSVWEGLPNAEDFLMHLKMKAGLSEDYWSDTITVERYTTQTICSNDV